MLARALCATLRTPRTADDEAQLNLTSDQWRALGSLAIRQRVAGLFVAASTDVSDTIPADTQRALAQRTRTAALRSLRFQAEFVQLARAVAPFGIDLLMLKGLHLATSVYPQAPLREMNDIDILVRREHVPLVAKAAVDLGFTSTRDADLRVVMRTRQHLPLMFKSSVGLEIHWDLAPRGEAPLADSDSLWARAERNRIASNVFQLSPEDLLLHICAHATVSHLLDLGIRPLCDVKAILATEGHRLDWTVVTARAAEWHCERGVALALALAHNLLGVSPPAGALDALRPAMPTPSVLHWAADLVFDDHDAPGVTEAAGRLVTMASTSDKLKYAWGRVVLSPDQLALLYPKSTNAHPLIRAALPLRRLWDLSRKYCGHLLSLAMNPVSEQRKVVDRRSAVNAWVRNET